MIGIITQARINSNRLPNKIFLKAGQHSFLYYHIQRLKQTKLPIIVATTDDGSEQPIISFCESNGIPCFRGDEQNVLQRFYQCADQYKLDTIIRVTSDCPLIDPRVIAKGVEAYHQFDDLTYYSNTIKRTYPRGMDYEIFSFRSLKEAYENASDAADREHVTPYIWKNRCSHVTLRHDIQENDDSSFRITLDTVEDQQLLTTLIEQYGAEDLNCNDIVALLKEHPELVTINKEIEQKKV